MKKAAHYQSLEYDRVVVLMKAFQRGKTLRVLDFGCGPGKFLDCFSGLGCEVTGVDINPDYVRKARARGYRAYGPEEFFATGEEQRYDVVFTSHLIEHVGPEELMSLVPKLCARLTGEGQLVVISPTPGDRFYHDFSHIRPYLPQSIRHAFGNTGMAISYGEVSLIDLVDIHFFRDPYRTRYWRSFYVGKGWRRACVNAVNHLFDALWRVSGGRIGRISSWLGVYRLKASR